MGAHADQPRPEVPTTALICIDCQYPRLALRALDRSLAQRRYEAVRFLTDWDGRGIPVDPRIEVVPIARIASATRYSHFMLKELAGHVDTDFVQVIQWDGYVTRGESWRDEFFDYDYIGARWYFLEPPRNVGNGGFSLRSRRLLEVLARDDFPAMDVEDEAIGQHYRDRLEAEHGIRIAPGAVADLYAFEGTLPTGREFGFHRVFNFPYFMDERELAEVLSQLPDEAFCREVSVTLVQKLVILGRKREALRYAERIRSQPAIYRAFVPEFRAKLERMMTGLAGRNDPCPCGSGRAFKRCCGAIDRWVTPA